MSQNLPSFRLMKSDLIQRKNCMCNGRDLNSSLNNLQLAPISKALNLNLSFNPNSNLNLLLAPLRSAAPNPMPSSAQNTLDQKLKLYLKHRRRRKEYHNRCNLVPASEAQPVPKAHGSRFRISSELFTTRRTVSTSECNQIMDNQPIVNQLMDNRIYTRKPGHGLSLHTASLWSAYLLNLPSISSNHHWDTTRA